VLSTQLSKDRQLRDKKLDRRRSCDGLRIVYHTDRCSLSHGSISIAVLLLFRWWNAFFLSPTHSFIPGFKPFFSANLSHRSLSYSSSRLTTWIPQTFTVISEHVRFYFLVFFCFALWLSVPCGRLSWLMSAFERPLKRHLVSYRIVSYRAYCGSADEWHLFRGSVVVHELSFRMNYWSRWIRYRASIGLRTAKEQNSRCALRDDQKDLVHHRITTSIRSYDCFTTLIRATMRCSAARHLYNTNGGLRKRQTTSQHYSHGSIVFLPIVLLKSMDL